MAILEAEFDSEKELESWVKTNIGSFIPGSLIIDGFSVATPSGKRGIPDGFAFDFANREWYVIECELLTHGVWPHIAEQVVRFVVAMQNDSTLRKIRDRIFEHVMEVGSAAAVVNQLGTTRDRLLQQIELFIEGVPARFAIFIDKTNKDLEDMAHALDAPTLIYRVQKFLVNDEPEYHSPDRHAPAIESEPEKSGVSSETDFDVVEMLGGGELSGQTRRFKAYRLSDETVIHVKRSKYHARNNYYWYGINPNSLEHMEEHRVTHLVFVMGDYGFAKVPLDTVKQFLQNAKTTNNPDGSVRHYHCLISHASEPELFWSNEVPKFNLSEFFYSFSK